MRVLVPTVAAVALLALAPTLARAEYASIEAAAVITDDNVFRFESESIARQGPRLRFDVTVAWRDGFVRPADAPPGKVIRYLTDCKVGELALAAVSTFTDGSQDRKTYGVAPGGWEFVKPEAGSREAMWMKKACDSLL